MDSKGKNFVPGGWMGTDKWESCHLVLTNIGMFMFDSTKLATAAPDVCWIHQLSIKTLSAKVATQSYILEIYANNTLKWTVSLPND